LASGNIQKGLESKNCCDTKTDFHIKTTLDYSEEITVNNTEHLTSETSHFCCNSGNHHQQFVSLST